jgi:translation initiation factor IF-3
MNLNNIRVIYNNESLFVDSVEAAQKMADDVGLDLVEVSDNVFKIMDYQKYVYEKNKAKMKQHKQETKRLQLHLGIAQYDLQRKANDACKWLTNGAQVIIVVQLRGREQSHPELGYKVMQQVIDVIHQQLSELIVPAPQLSNGRDIIITLNPRK